MSAPPAVRRASRLTTGVLVGAGVATLGVTAYLFTGGAEAGGVATVPPNVSAAIPGNGGDQSAAGDQGSGADHSSDGGQVPDGSPEGDLGSDPGATGPGGPTQGLGPAQRSGRRSFGADQGSGSQGFGSVRGPSGGAGAPQSSTHGS